MSSCSRKDRPRSFWKGLLGGFLLLASAGAQASLFDDFGPIFSVSPLTLERGTRTEAVGPLFYSQESEAGNLLGFPPVMSLQRDPETDRKEFDVLYPVLTYDHFGSEYRFQIFQLFSFSGGKTTKDEIQKKRFTLFPFIFTQRVPSNPEMNYTAVLPFYGRLENHFFRDEMDVVAFPVYLKSRKGQMITKNYMFPFFHQRSGGGVTGWQLWPITGKEHKDVTYKTNVLDELEVVAGHDKFFVLWPIYFKNTVGIGTDNPTTQNLLLPFYSIQKSPKRDTRSYLWPLGLTLTEDREKGYRETGAPWPLVVFSRGTKTVNRVWPFFSQAKNEKMQSDFYLWPVYKYQRYTSAPLDRERTRILFFLYSDVIERDTVHHTARERTDLWPLFTARRDHDGSERLQILSILEPLIPNNKSIERNYSPLWSLWRSEKNAKTGASSQSLLWNLYRSDQTPETKKRSLLFGLFQYQSGPDGRAWRLFYIPIGKKAEKTVSAR